INQEMIDRYAKGALAFTFYDVRSRTFSIIFAGGKYLFGPAFDRKDLATVALGLSADDGRLSDVALGIGLIAHEVGHAYQELKFMQQYGDVVGHAMWLVQYAFDKKNTSVGWSPYEIGVRAIATLIANDYQKSMTGE